MRTDLDIKKQVHCLAEPFHRCLLWTALSLESLFVMLQYEHIRQENYNSPWHALLVENQYSRGPIAYLPEQLWHSLTHTNAKTLMHMHMHTQWTPARPWSRLSRPGRP